MSEYNDAAVEGIHYRTGERIKLICKDGKISEIKVLSSTPAKRNERSCDLHEIKEGLPLIGPGLVDLQINGFQGYDFNHRHLTSETVKSVTRLLLQQGVTSYYPTLITESSEHIERALRTIAAACAEDLEVASMISGIHVEGPYISPKDGARGAHALKWVRKPDFEEFTQWQQAAEGRIKLITLSPEWENAEVFIRQCVAAGITVSIGHTSASSSQIKAAVAAGASMSTHFGNGIQAELPRHPNVLWAQLAADELSCCLIADGFHLPEEVLKVALKVKGDQALLVSDAVALCGMPPGYYDTPVGGKVVLTPEGRLHLAESPELLAGSAQLLTRGIEHLTRSGICRLERAWDIASVIPSSMMGLSSARGIEVGAPADVLLASWDGEQFKVLRTYKAGKCSE
ncbi:N-acetylglucosamine-6-phosphate deacetylase [Paenibacillus sp. J45TS6]|uniref:N-acetylglucosamine-6-phosphate deacetylase n=1 Tax=Paenibacillus sp. J45TS6 TaxID=2807196 RepID=UPI001B247F68|nr:amidohydrolase family protein [Paenibacillus sp. J45TS6]GIP43015.1 N-acetylglucosamine-6-phosphate deacetylase [Paenibacillus sp. J45TS6]